MKIMTYRPVTVTILPELKRKRQNNETVGEKASRLKKMCLYSAHRIKVETEEARASRLKQLSDLKKKRKKLSGLQKKRSSSETEEERASRLKKTL